MEAPSFGTKARKKVALSDLDMMDQPGDFLTSVVTVEDAGRSTGTLPVDGATSQEDLNILAFDGNASEQAAHSMQRKKEQVPRTRKSDGVCFVVDPNPSRNSSIREQTVSSKTPRRTTPRTKKLVDYTKSRGRSYEHKASPLVYKELAPTSCSEIFLETSWGKPLDGPMATASRVQNEILELQRRSLSQTQQCEDRVEFFLKIPSVGDLGNVGRKPLSRKREQDQTTPGGHSARRHSEDAAGSSQGSKDDSARLPSGIESRSVNTSVSHRAGRSKIQERAQWAMERRRIQEICESRKYSDDNVACSPLRTFFRNQPKRSSKTCLTVLQREIRSIASSSGADDDTTSSSSVDGWVSAFLSCDVQTSSASRARVLQTTRTNIETVCELLYEHGEREQSGSTSLTL